MKIDIRLNTDLKDKISAYFGKFLKKEDFIDLELVKLMVQITNKTGLEVSVVLNRKGMVKDILVNEKERTDLTNLEKGENSLSGLRLIHTVPKGDSNLSAIDRATLINYKFDCVCAIGASITGMVGAHVGYLNGNNIDIVFVPNILYVNKYGLLDRIGKYDVGERSRSTNMISNMVRQQRAVLVMAEIDKFDDIVTDIRELEGLSETAGINVVDKLWQKRSKPDP